MKKMNDLSNNELTKILLKTNEEIERRKNIKRATDEIRQVLEKFKLNVSDLEIDALKKRKSPTKKKTAKKPSKVAPKYFSPDGREKWTGRGKTPLWVKSICDEAGITLDQFKKENTK